MGCFPIGLRTTPNISQLLQPIEDVIRTMLIPTLTARPPPNDIERRLLALPARLGGITIINPVETSNETFLASTKVTDPLKDSLMSGENEYSYEVHLAQSNAKRELAKIRRALPQIT